MRPKHLHHALLLCALATGVATASDHGASGHGPAAETPRLTSWFEDWTLVKPGYELYFYREVPARDRSGVTRTGWDVSKGASRRRLAFDATEVPRLWKLEWNDARRPLRISREATGEETSFEWSGGRLSGILWKSNQAGFQVSERWAIEREESGVIRQVRMFRGKTLVRSESHYPRPAETLWVEWFPNGLVKGIHLRDEGERGIRRRSLLLTEQAAVYEGGAGSDTRALFLNRKEDLEKVLAFSADSFTDFDRETISVSGDPGDGVFHVQDRARPPRIETRQEGALLEVRTLLKKSDRPAGPRFEAFFDGRSWWSDWTLSFCDPLDASVRLEEVRTDGLLRTTSWKDGDRARREIVSEYHSDRSLFREREYVDSVLVDRRVFRSDDALARAGRPLATLP